MLSSRFVILVMLMSLVLGGTAYAKDDFYEISLATLYTPGQTQFKNVFEAFAKEVEERSDGSLIINVFGVGTIVASFEEAHAVKSGNIDIGPLTAVMSKEVAYITLLQLLPDLSRSIADTVRIGPILYNGLPEIKKETDFYGIPIAYTSTVPQVLLSNSELIKTPADLKGKRMLVMSASAAIQAEAWGAIPVMVGMSDVYIGLQRGMGEAVLAGTSWIKGAKLYETAKYMTMLNYPSTTYIPYVINKELFADLSENQQSILVEMAAEYFGTVWQKSWESDYDEALKIFEEAGCQVHYPNEDEALLWQEVNKTAVPIAIERAELSGISREEALNFLDRAYDLLEANNFEVNRYIED